MHDHVYRAKQAATIINSTTCACAILVINHTVFWVWLYSFNFVLLKKNRPGTEAISVPELYIRA